jgi:hypothetical protein
MKIKSAPSVHDLLRSSEVQLALAKAWTDSRVDEPTDRHEEGGWIYTDLVSGNTLVRRAIPGLQSQIDLSNPPIISGHFVVATFHTHPNPSGLGWNPLPSESDTKSAFALGVPCIVISDRGQFTTDLSVGAEDWMVPLDSRINIRVQWESRHK